MDMYYQILNTRHINPAYRQRVWMEPGSAVAVAPEFIFSLIFERPARGRVRFIGTLMGVEVERRQVMDFERWLDLTRWCPVLVTLRAAAYCTAGRRRVLERVLVEFAQARPEEDARFRFRTLDTPAATPNNNPTEGAV